MRLAFFLQPRADSSYILCHTRSPEAGSPRLCCVAAGEETSFSLEDVEKKQPRGDFWQLVLAILIRGRDLVLELEPGMEAGRSSGVSIETLMAELERCRCLFPLHLLGNYRSLDSLPELIILFVAQGNRSPSALQQTGIMEKLPLRDWMLFACPGGKKLSGKFSGMAALRDINPTLEQRLDKLSADWSECGSLRCLPLELGEDWMEKIACSLHMVHLDRFHDSMGPVRKVSPLTWEKDVFPVVLGGTPPFDPSGERPPILSGSMLERAFSSENREKLFFSDSGSLRHKVRHVILRGATGTGKSTLGRLILLHDMLRDDSARVVYMGPTRMLVEESYAAFCALAGEFAEQEDLEAVPLDKIVISTGERVEQDERIQKGDFRALFIVYEKLNNFFHDTRLIRQLNCVMVDEVQMICDTVRGGVLDSILTSLCREANRRFDVEDGAEFLRLIICTTENFDLEERFTLQLSFRDGGKRSPLILEDGQYFRKPSTWFQFRVKKKMHSLPLELDIPQAVNSLVTPHRYLESVSRAEKSAPLRWLKEWMWGHEKVLYVYFSPAAMLSLAEDLAEGRPDMVTDEILLRRLHDELLQEAFSEQCCERIVNCARKGIFFNFATMGYAARGTSTFMFRTCPYQQGVPVVTFATSTIMYGVNLPADLLILKELSWPQTNIGISSTGSCPAKSLRRRYFGYLRQCEIRNMAGRVGRQGLSSPHVVPVVLYSSFVPVRDGQRRHFQKFIESLVKSQAEYSSILGRMKSPPRVLADFSSVQQRFFMNCLLHSCDKENNCSLEQVQAFVESTWAWERVRQDHETEVWRQSIADFFCLLQQEFPECLQSFEKRGKTWLVPLPFCYSVCKTGSDLGTLKELRELLLGWDMQAYPQQAHAVIVLLSLILTKEFWILFLDFHQEAKWGEDQEECDGVFRLSEYQQGCLEATERQEKALEEAFRRKLQDFMDTERVEAALLHMRQVLARQDLPLSLTKGVEGIERRKVLMAFRSALALLAWGGGRRGEDIDRYHFADPLSPQANVFFLLDESASFHDKYVMRQAYALSSLYVYCKQSGLDKDLTEAVDVANTILQKGQGL